MIVDRFESRLPSLFYTVPLHFMNFVLFVLLLLSRSFSSFIMMKQYFSVLQMMLLNFCFYAKIINKNIKHNCSQNWFLRNVSSSILLGYRFLFSWARCQLPTYRVSALSTVNLILHNGFTCEKMVSHVLPCQIIFCI